MSSVKVESGARSRNVGVFERRKYGDDVEFVDVFASEETNPYITETAGFVPLQVRIKQQLLAGQQLQVQRSQFDYQDWLDTYDDDFSPDVINDKFQAMELIQRIEERKQKVLRQAQEQELAEFAEWQASKRSENSEPKAELASDSSSMDETSAHSSNT